MDHHWVATSWLSDVGLPQYSQTFQAHLVDGRVLNSLSHRDLKQFLNIGDQSHQTSLLLAIQLLQIVSFDKEVSAHAKSLQRPLSRPRWKSSMRCLLWWGLSQSPSPLHYLSRPSSFPWTLGVPHKGRLSYLLILCFHRLCRHGGQSASTRTGTPLFGQVAE